MKNKKELENFLSKYRKTFRSYVEEAVELAKLVSKIKELKNNE